MHSAGGNINGRYIYDIVDCVKTTNYPTSALSVLSVWNGKFWVGLTWGLTAFVVFNAYLGPMSSCDSVLSSGWFDNLFSACAYVVLPVWSLIACTVASFRPWLANWCTFAVCSFGMILRLLFLFQGLISSHSHCSSDSSLSVLMISMSLLLSRLSPAVIGGLVLAFLAVENVVYVLFLLSTIPSHQAAVSYLPLVYRASYYVLASYVGLVSSTVVFTTQLSCILSLFDGSPSVSVSPGNDVIRETSSVDLSPSRRAAQGLPTSQRQYLRDTWASIVLPRFSDSSLEKAFDTWYNEGQLQYIVSRNVFLFVVPCVLVLDTLRIGASSLVSPGLAYGPNVAVFVLSSLGIFVQAVTWLLLVVGHCRDSYPKQVTALYVMSCTFYSVVFLCSWNTSLISSLSTTVSVIDPMMFTMLMCHALLPRPIESFVMNCMLVVLSVLLMHYFLDYDPEIVCYLSLRLAMMCLVCLFGSLAVRGWSRREFLMTKRLSMRGSSNASDQSGSVPSGHSNPSFCGKVSVLVQEYSCDMASTTLFYLRVKRNGFASISRLQGDDGAQETRPGGDSAASWLCVSGAHALRERVLQIGMYYHICERFDDFSSVGRCFTAKWCSDLSEVLTRMACENDGSVSFLFPNPILQPNLYPLLNLTVITVGSRGDVQPFVELSKGLKAAGHNVRLSTHGKFEAFVKSADLLFFPLALVGRADHWQPEQLMQFAEDVPKIGPDALAKPTVFFKIMRSTPLIRSVMKTLFLPPGWEERKFGPLGACSSPGFKCDAIVANPPSFTHFHLAERFGAPLHIAFTMPWNSTKMVGHPMCVHDDYVAGSNPFWRRLSFRWIDFLQWTSNRGAINEFRVKALKIPPLRIGQSAAHILDKSKIPFSYFFSPKMFAKPTDWGPQIDITGFLFGPQAIANAKSFLAAPEGTEFQDHTSYKAPDSLVKFLSSGEPPVYVFFGSISHDLTAIYECFVRVFAALPESTRVIFHKGWCSLGPSLIDLIMTLPASRRLVIVPASTNHESFEYLCTTKMEPDSFAVMDGVSHDWLFPRCKAIVHHGGIGTTSIALLYGRPAVIVSFFLDQAFWGSTITYRRVGWHIPSTRVTDLTVKQGLDAVLEPGIDERARSLAKNLCEEAPRGVQNLVDAFHRQLPLELITCKFCFEESLASAEHARPHLATFIVKETNWRLCDDCAERLDERASPLRSRIDWGRNRHHWATAKIVSLLKQVRNVFTYPILGRQQGGIPGLILGICLSMMLGILAVFSLAFLPLLVIYDLLKVVSSAMKQYHIAAAFNVSLGTLSKNAVERTGSDVLSLESSISLSRLGGLSRAQSVGERSPRRVWKPLADAQERLNMLYRLSDSVILSTCFPERALPRRSGEVVSLDAFKTSTAFAEMELGAFTSTLPLNTGRASRI